MRRELAPPLSFAAGLRGFFTLAEKTVRARAAYRMSTVVLLVTNAAAYVVFLLVWRQLYASGKVAALPREKLFAYLIVAFALNTGLPLLVEGRFVQRLRQGLIGTDLLRPIGFMPAQLAQAVGDAAMSFGLALPVYGLGVLFVGREVLPHGVASFGLGLASILLALLVSFGVSYLVVQVAFVTQTAYGIIFARASLHQAFSGVAAPLALFPDRLATWASWLPFRHVIETPVRILLGLAPAEEIPRLLLAQALWAAGLLAVSSGIFHLVLRRHQIQGG